MHRCLVFDANDRNRIPPKMLTQTDIVVHLMNLPHREQELEVGRSVGRLMFMWLGGCGSFRVTTK